MSKLGGAPLAPAHSARASDARDALRVAVVGVSVQSPCGVCDHATLLAGALEGEGISCSLHWLAREQRALRAARSELRRWRGQLSGELSQLRPDAVLLHYSAFSYSHRGVPVFAHPVLSAIAATDAPLLVMAHELAYPWGRAGWRGRLWATTQRAALVELLRAAAGVIVTSEDQRRWLSSRAWLPGRPARVAPVFSNLPAPSGRARSPRSQSLIGVFGYAYQGAEQALVLEAVALLERRGIDVRLVLLGAPGRSSQAGEQWLAAARAAGIEGRVSFIGPLPAQELSDELADCDVLVSCPRSGPTSRKGTLAGSLASGTPVVAIDGPRTWAELLEAQAAAVVAPTPEALAGGLAALLSDEPRREALGARGRAFAESRMSLAGTAGAVTSLLEDLRAGAAPAAMGDPAPRAA